MFASKNMHFQRLSCWANMSTNYTRIPHWRYVFGLNMFPYRSGWFRRILATRADPQSIHSPIHLASDHVINLWNSFLSNFSLVFISYFMHFHGMPSRANFQALWTLKTRRWDMLSFYMCFYCGFGWVCIVTGTTTPETTEIFWHQGFNCRFNFSNISRHVNWGYETFISSINKCLHLTMAMVSIFVNVQRISGWTMLLANRTFKAFSLQVLCFNMHTDNWGTIRCKITFCAAPLPIR